MNHILSSIVGAILSVGSFLGIYHAPAPIVAPTETPALGSATTINLAGTFPYFLAGSGISSSATSIVLTSFTLPQNSYPIQDADLDATFYLTIEPGNRTKQEFVSCTTVGTNTGGTVTLSGCTRGLSPITPYTASSTLKFVHAGGSTVILSNPPQIYNDIYNYVNAASFAGSVTASEAAKGISELATAAEQAASTVTGGSGPLVLQAQYATSTWNSATAANKVIVAGSGGKIDNNFIATSTLFVNSTFTGTTTMASSTNIGSFPAFEIGQHIQYITTTGTSTWTKPAGVNKVTVEVLGGGSRGGASGGAGVWGGGGSGGRAIETIDVSATTSVQVYVAPDSGVGPGFWTTFGTNGFYLSATGGSEPGASIVGAPGGLGSGGDINIPGAPGLSGATGDHTGEGGSNPYGAGGTAVASGAGNDGRGYGSGGSGAGTAASAAGQGKQGLIKISY